MSPDPGGGGAAVTDRLADRITASAEAEVRPEPTRRGDVRADGHAAGRARCAR